ncbi:MAG: hypothetical protein AB2A00_23085 [Myxococcota bacterium]
MEQARILPGWLRSALAWGLSLLGLAAACPTTSGGPGGTTGGVGSCPAGPGIIAGDPQLTIGRGSSEFVAVADGDRWTAARGPQGGQHLWLSVRTVGLGPEVQPSYRYLEPDGGVIFESAGTRTTVCARVGGGQEKTGLTAFLPNESVPLHRLLCQGPFLLRVTVSDETGATAEDQRLVGGVDPDPESFVPFRFRCDAGASSDDGGPSDAGPDAG